MKRLLLSLLLAAGSVGALCAMDVAESSSDIENFVFDPDKKSVPFICDKVVKSHREALSDSEEVRGRWQVVTAGAVIAGTGYLIYRWWNESSKKMALGENALKRAKRDEEMDEFFSKLKVEQFEKLKEDLKRKEDEEKAKAAAGTGTAPGAVDASAGGGAAGTAPAPVTPPAEPKKAEEIEVEVQGTKVNKKQLEDFIYRLVEGKTLVERPKAWYERAWNWTKDTATSGAGWLIFIPMILFKQRIAHEMSKYIFGYFPYPGQFASYLFTPRSVLWAMHEHTQFETVAKSLNLLAYTFKQIAAGGQAGVSPDLLKVNAWNKTRLFVKEMEKVLGYMQYVIMQLPKGDHENRDTGTTSLKLITSTVNEAAKIVNAFLRVDPIEPKHLAAIASVFEEMLLSVVTELESFDLVARTAGFEDLDEGKRFDYWKHYLQPQLPKTPMIQEAEAHAADFADYKKVFEQVVDLKGIIDAGF